MVIAEVEKAVWGLMCQPQSDLKDHRLINLYAKAKINIPTYGSEFLKLSDGSGPKTPAKKRQARAAASPASSTEGQAEGTNGQKRGADGMPQQQAPTVVGKEARADNSATAGSGTAAPTSAAASSSSASAVTEAQVQRQNLLSKVRQLTEAAGGSKTGNDD